MELSAGEIQNMSLLSGVAVTLYHNHGKISLLYCADFYHESVTEKYTYNSNVQAECDTETGLYCCGVKKIHSSINSSGKLQRCLSFWIDWF